MKRDGRLPNIARLLFPNRRPQRDIEMGGADTAAATTTASDEGQSQEGQLQQQQQQPVNNVLRQGTMFSSRRN